MWQVLSQFSLAVGGIPLITLNLQVVFQFFKVCDTQWYHLGLKERPLSKDGTSRSHTRIFLQIISSVQSLLQERFTTSKTPSNIYSVFQLLYNNYAIWSVHLSAYMFKHYQNRLLLFFFDLLCCQQTQINIFITKLYRESTRTR